MTDKMILRKGDKTAGYAPVFVSIDCHARVKQIGAEANVSMRDVVEACIRFGLERLEIVEDDHATN
ncbi:hypothetical protein [Lacticaseibacillus absianus]|uniref:hypothetical protein n=1 Tax=Lacticaseibacillus absianus TaxID=2729623 RepID=UPI0015CC17E3|nr:hypothetical protein [Lacticaseibacillus absianus]